VRRPQLVDFYSLSRTSIFAIFAKRRSVRQLTGQRRLDYPQRLMEGIPTRPKPARSPSPSVTNDSRQN